VLIALTPGTLRAQSPETPVTAPTPAPTPTPTDSERLTDLETKVVEQGEKVEASEHFFTLFRGKG